MINYQGPDRRRVTDHDTIIETLALLKSHVDNFDKHLESYKDHIKDDSTKFGSIDKSLFSLNRGMWVAVGVLGTLEFFLRVLGK